MFSFISGYYGLELRRIHNIRYFKKSVLQNKRKEKFIARTFSKASKPPQFNKIFFKNVANYLTKICICGIV